MFVSAEPAKDLAIGVIERMVGALKRGVGAFVEPGLRLISAVHAEGGRRGDRKRIAAGRMRMIPTVAAALGCGTPAHDSAPASRRETSADRCRKGDSMPNKILLITGASRGIGRACALLAAENAWAVGVNYREDAKSADAVVETIAQDGGRAVALKGDVSVEADAVAMFDAATTALGPPTAVIANAGIVAPTAKLADMSAERMRRIFEVNVLGAFLTAREAARRLSKSSGGAGGSIVLMSSAAARLGSPNLYIDYAASKGAIDTLTLGLAKELGPEGVRVNAIRPGLVDTEIHASGGEPDRARILGATAPLGRPGSAEEIAAAAIWLISDAASYVTGALLDVSGGR